MSASILPLHRRPSGFGGHDPQWSTERREERHQTICRAEYTRYPRASTEHRSRVGFTLDQSASGFCLGTAAPEDVGSLLSVRLVSIDGQEQPDSLARVMWCNETAEPGQYRIGLLVVTEARRKMRLVRRDQRLGRKLAESA